MEVKSEIVIDMEVVRQKDNEMMRQLQEIDWNIMSRGGIVQEHRRNVDKGK